jgi:hypothetical protein
VERTAELAQTLDELMTSHEGWNNFYNEPPVARRLLNLVGHYGTVPTQLRQRYVLDLVYVFLSNGHGVALSADSIYRELIQQFDEPQASISLRSFTMQKISSRLHTTLARQQWAELLTLMSPNSLAGVTERYSRRFKDSRRRRTDYRQTPQSSSI